MKTKLFLTLLSFLVSTTVFSQIVGGQVDDFEDGTTQLWSEGGPSINPPINIATGGPAGTNDNYLQNDSSGSGRGGSRMVMFNSNIRWGGNYTSAGIVAITCDVRVATNTLNLRLAMEGSGGRISSTNAVVVAPSSNWTNITLPVTASDMSLAGGSSVANTLANVTELRILSNTSPNFAGEIINARLEIDNITATTTLSTDDALTDAFKMYPSPVTNILNFDLSPNINQASVKIYNALGEEIHEQNISKNNKSINTSNWLSGLYIARLVHKENIQIKRFIKQ